jgi:hypothetical protein
MKRLVASLTLGMALLAAVAVSASGSHNNGVGSIHDVARGSGELLLPVGQFAFPSKITLNAKSDADGSNVKGRFSMDIDSGPFAGHVIASGDVTCLNVFNGNEAIVGGVITETNNPSFAPEGSGVLGRGKDNGKDVPDQLHAHTTVAPPPNCDTYPFGQLTPITSGDFIVHERL